MFTATKIVKEDGVYVEETWTAKVGFANHAKAMKRRGYTEIKRQPTPHGGLSIQWRRNKKKTLRK